MTFRGKLRQCSEIVRCDMFVFLRSRVGVFWTFVFPILALFAYTQVVTAPSLAGAVVLVDTNPSDAASAQQAIDAIRLLKNQGVTLAKGNDKVEALASASVRTLGNEAHITITSKAVDDSRYPLLIGAIRENIEAATRPETREGRVMVIEHSGLQRSRKSRADYIVPGLAVMIAMSSALMGFAVPLAAMKEFGLTRQHVMWPVPAAYLLAAWGVGKLLIIIGSTAMLVVIAVLLYGFGSQATFIGILEAVCVLLLGTAALLCLGLAMAARINSTQTATVVANMIYFFGIFTGNILLPASAVAPWLRRILLYSPINSIADGIRLSLYPPLGQIATPHDLLLKIAIIVIFGLVCFTFAARSYDLGGR